MPSPRSSASLCGAGGGSGSGGVGVTVGVEPDSTIAPPANAPPTNAACPDITTAAITPARIITMILPSSPARLHWKSRLDPLVVAAVERDRARVAHRAQRGGG